MEINSINILASSECADEGDILQLFGFDISTGRLSRVTQKTGV